MAGGEKTQIEREPLRNIAEKHALNHAKLRPELRRVGERVGHEPDPAKARRNTEEETVDRQRVDIEAKREGEPVVKVEASGSQG